MSQFIDECHEGGIGIETIFRSLLYFDGDNYYINFLDSGLSEGDVTPISDCEDHRTVEQLFRLALVEDLNGNPAISTVTISEGALCDSTCEFFGLESSLKQCFYTDGTNIYLGIKEECNLLLNQYPDSVSGYSLGLINCDYTGNCIEVRRSSDNAQLDIGFSNNILDTAALLAFAGAGDAFIVTWYDQKGSNDWSQATALQQLQIVSAGAMTQSNGVNAMRFIPNDTMQTGSGFAFGLNDFSYLISFSSNVPAAEGYMIGVASLGSPVGAGMAMNQPQNDIRSRPFGAATAYTTSNLNDGANHTAFQTLDRDGNAIIYSDGVSDLVQDISPFAANSLSANPWCLGAENCTGSFFTGYVWNVIVFNRVMTPAEVTDINSQL